MKIYGFETSLLVFVVLGYHANLCDSNSICTKTTLSNCMIPLNNEQITGSVIPSADKNTILEYCSKYTNFSSCYNSLRPYCTSGSVEETVAIYDGIDKSYGYLCRDSLHEYMSYQECFSDPDLQSDAKSCNETLVNQLKRITSEPDPRIKMAKYCQFADTYMGCTSNLLKTFCGENAANWLTTFDRKSLETIMISYNCPGWVSDSTTPAIANSSNQDYTLIMILCISIGVFGVIVVVVAFILIISKCKSCLSCCCYQRDVNHDHRRLSVSSDLPPPPYPGSFVYYDLNGCPIPVQPVIEGVGSHQGGAEGRDSNPNHDHEKLTLKLTMPASGAPHVARSYSEPACLELPVSMSTSGSGIGRNNSLTPGSGVGRNSSLTIESHVGFPVHDVSSVICPSTPTTHFELPSNLPMLSLLGDDQLERDTSCGNHTDGHQPPCDYY